MPNLKGALICAILTATLPLAAHAQDETAPTADTVLATVGDTQITLGHLIAAIGDLEPQEQGLPNEVLLQGLSERLIQQAAIAQTAGELSRATELRLENERRALIAGEIVGAAAQQIEIGDAEIQAAYDARYGDEEASKEFNASHILVETEEEAQALADELEEGADFAELAREKSTGPSGPEGGSLGWFPRGAMVSDFQDAVDTLEVGEVSAPVQTRFGWHVIKLNETRIPEAPTLESVAGELRQQVFREKLGQQIAELIGTVEIERTDLGEIDPALVRDGSLIGR